MLSAGFLSISEYKGGTLFLKQAFPPGNRKPSPARRFKDVICSKPVDYHWQERTLLYAIGPVQYHLGINGHRGFHGDQTAIWVLGGIRSQGLFDQKDFDYFPY